MFPGQKGFVSLAAKENLTITGKVTGEKYEFVAGVEQYVDRRDLPGLGRERFEKLNDADTAETGKREKEAPELVWDSKGS